jgi:hypothetical protein
MTQLELDFGEEFARPPEQVDTFRRDMDVLWSIATNQAITENEPQTRYHFAKLVIEKYT